MKNPDLHPSQASLEELMLYSVAKLPRRRLRGLRDAVVLALASEAGLRGNEFARLRWSHLDLNGRAIRVFEGKGRERTVSISPLTAAVLARLRELTPEGEWVFPSGTRPASPVRRRAQSPARRQGGLRSV